MYPSEIKKRQERLGLKQISKFKARRRRFLLITILVLIALCLFSINHALGQSEPVIINDLCELDSVVCEEEVETYRTMTAYVTGYNTVSWQTDDTPCIASRNINICGRDDAIACPREIPFDTVVGIDGQKYICLDRTAKKYNDRFDISCDKDMTCPNKVTGWKEIKIYD